MDGLKGGGLMRKAEIQRKTNETDIRLELSLDGEGALNGLTHIGFFDHMLHSFELVEEFFKSVAFNAQMNLHMKVLSGSNVHHIIEALFKAFGKALDQATQKDERIKHVMSTKGVI